MHTLLSVLLAVWLPVRTVKGILHLSNRRAMDGT